MVDRSRRFFGVQDKRTVAVAAGVDLQPVPMEDMKMFFYALQLKEQKDYAKAELLFRYLLTRAFNTQYIERVKTELAYCFYGQHKYEALAASIADFLTAQQFDPLAMQWLDELCVNKDAQSSMISMLTSLVNRHPDSSSLNNRLGICYQKAGDLAQARRYVEASLMINNNWDNLSLRKNYLELHEILKEQKVKEVFVQYPNMKVLVLKKMFSSVDNEDLIFVDNESGFAARTDMDKYRKFFKDEIFPGFGHATVQGNSVLAAHIAKAIVSNICY